MGDANEDSLAALSLRLRILRARQGLQMGGLQQRTGLGRTTISQALNGQKVPSEATLVALARAMAVDVEPLLALREAAARVPQVRKVYPSVARRSARSTVQPSFEERYLSYVAERHSQLTVVGLDLSLSQRAHWPLDAAYLSLELAEQPTSWLADNEEADRPPIVVKRAENALADCQRVLLRGLAGSGKTTLLQWLAVAAARDELPEELGNWRGQIPFVLPLRTLVRRGPLPEPHHFLTAVGTPLAASQPEGWADDVLARGTALVLVDGIDEVPQEHRNATRDWLERLIAAYKDAHFVVTTRPSAVPEGWLASSRFTELSVRPMNAPDIGVFVTRWHTAAMQSAATDAERSQLHDLETTLHTTVRAQRDLAQLSSTPLMCALICALHRDRRGHLPHSRMELYEAALSMLLVRRDLERSIDIPEGIQLTEHQSVQLLQRLAYWLIRNRQTEMGRATAEALVSDALPAMQAVAEQGTADQVLTHLVSRSGLLRQPTMDTIDFVHRTFQDYLGAKAAIEAHDFPLLVNNAHDDQWEDVLRMAVAHARPVESADLLRRIINRGDVEDDHRSRLHLLAAASLQYATEIEPETRRLVEQRARVLLPPRSREEAEELAALGPGILDLLPGPKFLEADEVGPVIKAATLIGGDHAYAFLRRFTQSLLPHSAPHDLFEGWEHFNADEYARDILLPFPAQKPIYLPVYNQDQRNALPLLKPITSIAFRGAFTADEIIEHLSAEHTKTLHIYNGQQLQELKFIRRLSALTNFSLSECINLTHIEDLAGLPLPNLSLSHLPEEFSFDALNSLPGLTNLSLYTRLPWERLSYLPAPKGLTSLSLGGWVGARLAGISRWRQLRALVINSAPDRGEWQEISTLPHLGELCISKYDLNHATPMPNITYLRLLPSSDPQLELVPELFPNLESLFINCRTSRSETTDISPLRHIKGLHIAISYASNITGLERFASDAVTVHPRLRTADI
ncbi:NACHT domain-containing protein [Streptomyces tsukubensis]|uniref:DNA-binding protein n=1 Tax=Streptomyces tsukubensis TaxID=83656 RepID=A0A1V4A4E6_9ACTN|nr:NACHT domain-containing protein [Streptomyces tsukubensis]OON74962.1 DNA-binding protein [Streptomyces tsukubensis]QFR94767.1 NACHT domain-containing protein [Streptomyces tsukubensis]